METIVKIYADVRREIKSFIKTPRYVDTYAAYRSVMQIFHDYAIEESLMDRQSADEMLNQDIRLILNLIIQNDRKVALISPGVTILQALKYEIDEKRIRILPLDQVTGAESLNATLIEDSDYFYIQAEHLWQCAKKYTGIRQIHFEYKSGKDIISPLDEENLLLKRLEGSSLRSSHKLGGKSSAIGGKRFLYLIKERVQRIWEDLSAY